MGKRATLLLIAILTVSSLTMVKSVSASIPKPHVPYFTLKYVDNSYDVPSTTTSTTDPYTNETTTTTIPGYHVKKFTIEVTITNQPFASSIDGNASNLYYNVRIKGHFTEDWVEQYSYSPSTLPAQSSSEYTVLSFPADYPPNGKVDFQVEAILGYEYTYYRMLLPFTSFVYKTSGWSNTQTLTIPASTPSPTPTPTSTPTPKETPQTLQLEAIIMVIAVVLVVAGLLIYFKKRKR